MSSSIPPVPSVGDFVTALEELVLVPPGRRGPSARIVLVQQGRGDEAEQIAEGECLRLRVRGRALVPYARIQESRPRGDRQRTRDVFEQIEDGLRDNLPGGFGRLRLPRYRLVRAFAAASSTEDQAPVRARDLRDQCYAERRKDSHVLKALHAIGGRDQTPDNIAAWIWHWARHPLFGVLPRWLYGFRAGRRMMRKGGWFRRWARVPSGRGDFFRHHEAVVAEREDALLCALLDDLEAAARGPRLSPWTRRRRSRFVLVLPREGAPGSVTESVVRGFPQAVEQTGSTAVVLLAVGQAGPDTPQSLAMATTTIDSWARSPGRGRGRAVAVGVEPLAGEPDQEAEGRLRGYPEIQPGRVHSDLAPRAEAFVMAVAGVTALSLLAYLAVVHFVDPASDRCLGASVRMPESAAPGRIPEQSPKELYARARESIDQQNKQAEKAAKRADTVIRTVAYLGIPVTVDNWNDGLYSGAIPELRGIALAQEQLNSEAAKDVHRKVWLRVRVLDAGPRFSNAPEVAGELVREMAERKGEPEIMGVVGLGQSRADTMAARDILGDAGLPVIGTTATALEMQQHGMYRQVAPDNRREARIAADLARRGNIVETSAGTCAPARAAVVVADPTDSYSANLGELFTSAFEGARTIRYTAEPGREPVPPASGDRVESASTLAEVAIRVCERIQEDPRTVVYWAARPTEFSAFLEEFAGGTRCDGRLTVLGGNDITNAVVDAQHPSALHPRVRLYYAAHALPKSHSPNVMGDRFRDQYRKVYGADDLWGNDGHAPLAWDALRLLGSAVNSARQDAGSAPFGLGTVQQSLVRGVGGPDGKRGATGVLAFDRNGKVPVNKRLLMLHDTASGPEVALECGFRASQDERTSWGPGGAFPCVRDE
ncbi:hypothetical protein [Streptomyces netropsis]|uniref:ABC-type branched-subunit amino acid transport system substrate-binding protein n=1 Tax=Streptomyces netropsis TaxID=55404 RepID=A0A7W7PDN3_STRNE|nr:hypothetical protein [Streptomyces netropsis]MBB4885797.1 ABC-type branched-subunit amino acid transport system substrate-binding protein [Streptomyces netropsis]GGR37278.1 hypothetical protein GCM10010219_47980 [Streptomyces netropsis]